MANIKNMIMYRAELPSPEDLELHLNAKPFSPVLESHAASTGFVPVLEGGRLVEQFPGGYAVRLRRDVKPISRRALRLAHDEAVRAAEADGKQLSPDERGALKEKLYLEQVKALLPERSEITAYYHSESNLLIVPTTSKSTACHFVSMLVEACGALKTSTIWVSNIKGGLTTRLSKYFQTGGYEHLDDDESEAAFDGFSVGDLIVMKGERGKASYDLQNLDDARNGLIEALGRGLQVERMELIHKDTLSFNLTHDFHVRKITLLGEQRIAYQESEFETAAEAWAHETGVMVAMLVDLINDLADLLGYKAPESPEVPSDA